MGARARVLSRPTAPRAPRPLAVPCWEATSPYAAFLATNASTCASVAPAGSVTWPFFSYNASAVGAASISISALAYRAGNSRLYFGDYSVGRIYSLATSPSSTPLIEMDFVYPADMAYVSGVGIVYVDAGHGTVASLAGTLDVSVSASPSPSVSPSKGASAASSATRTGMSAMATLAALAAAVTVTAASL